MDGIEKKKSNSGIGLDLLVNQKKKKSSDTSALGANQNITLNMSGGGNGVDVSGGGGFGGNNTFNTPTVEDVTRETLDSSTDNYKFNVESDTKLNDLERLNDYHNTYEKSKSGNDSPLFKQKSQTTFGGQNTFTGADRNDNFSADGMDAMSDNSNSSMDERHYKPEKTHQEIMNEKYELLYKLEALKKKGVKLPRDFTIESNLEDMRYNYEKVTSDMEHLAGVKVARKMLLAISTGVEFLNTKFDPFNIKLEGWSESIHENINDYDEVFEELYEKYKSNTKMAPELRLLFMVGGSAFMFHLTNSMFKNSLPGMGDILKQNPDLMKQFAGAAMNTMGQSNPGAAKFMGMANPGLFGGGMNTEQPAPQARMQRPQTMPRGQPSSMNIPRSGGQPMPMRDMRPPSGVDDIINELEKDLAGDSSQDLDNLSISSRDSKSLKTRGRRGRKKKNSITLNL
jgi:hypothetical protein